MRNRIVGVLIVTIALLIGFIIYSFNAALSDIVNDSCSHGSSCPMWGTIEFQTDLSIGIMIFIIAIGLYLIFFGQDEKIITKIKRVNRQVQPKKISKESYQKVMSELEKDEKEVLRNIIENNGTIFQSSLVDNTGFGKVRVTRILDKLESRGIVERKRRGMTNNIVLRQ